LIFDLYFLQSLQALISNERVSNYLWLNSAEKNCVRRNFEDSKAMQALVEMKRLHDWVKKMEQTIEVRI